MGYRSKVQAAIIYIDPDNPMNLQNQIRQKLVDGIINGAFPPGMKLPSSRKLAQQLNVARNTVVAAYQQLIADGYLVSRQRSGIFVDEKMLAARVGTGGSTLASGPFFAAYVVGENNYSLIITASTLCLILCMLAAVLPSKILDAEMR